MSKFTWFKHILLVAASVLLVWGIILLNGIDLREENFVQSLLFGAYTFFVSLVLLTFRVSLIGADKVKWITLILVAGLIALLSIMKLDMETVPTLWDVSLALFAMLLTEAFLSQLKRKNVFSLIVKLLLFATLGCFVVSLGFKLETPNFYSALNWLLLLTTLSYAVHHFLPEKR